MNSLSDAPVGVQTPRVASVPPAHSRAEAADAAFLARPVRAGSRSSGRWTVLDALMGTLADGRWSSPRAG